MNSSGSSMDAHLASKK
jgi:hypothetical protein